MNGPGSAEPEGGPVTPRRRGDRIEVRGLRATGVHGVLIEERQRAQPFEVDLDVWVDLSAAARSDELADTVDYGALALEAHAAVVGTSFRLIEALAGEIARRVLAADERVGGVSVAVRKLRPPVPVDVTSTGVRIARWRER